MEREEEEEGKSCKQDGVVNAGEVILNASHFGRRTARCASSCHSWQPPPDTCHCATKGIGQTPNAPVLSCHRMRERKVMKNVPAGIEFLHSCGSRKFSYNWYKGSVSNSALVALL
jgi:hypothetical protein